MARDVASVKSTGGGGFFYADRVAAVWLLHILAGRSPLDSKLGPPARLRFEKRSSGWLLDDLLAEFGSAPRLIRAAVSIKSACVIVGGALPEDFVRDCWELQISPGETAFDSARDLLVLATAPFARTTREALDRAISLAANGDPAEFDRNVTTPGWGNAALREIVDSFRCPADIPDGQPPRDRSVGALLRAVRVLEYDFEKVDSRSEVEALSLCREVVEDGVLGTASTLWRELRSLAELGRVSGGTFDRYRLLDELRLKVPLRNTPDDAVEWAKLRAVTEQWQVDTHDRIGGAITIPRSEVEERIATKAGSARAIAVLGESGVGKSVAVKHLLAQGAFAGPAFAVHAGELIASETGRGRALLNRPLALLLPTQTASQATLVLDGLDHLAGENDIRALARILRAMRLSDAASPWRLIVLCHAGPWDQLLTELRAAGAEIGPVEIVRVGLLERSELVDIAERLPFLSAIVLREDLRGIVGRPKILDLLASTAAEAVSAADWVGESNVIQLFFDRYLRAGGRTHAHAALAITVAKEAADARRFVTPIVELQRPEFVPEMTRIGVLVEKDETVRFSHDLHADYARQRYLLGELRAGRRTEIACRLVNPLWHRAIRLLGLQLLEAAQGPTPLDEWRSLLASFQTEGAETSLGVDLLLEAIAFAVNPTPLLDAIASDLTANDGALLKRFLTRFIYATTTLRSGFDPAQFTNPALRALAESRVREPDVFLWTRVLGWLIAHVDSVLTLAPDEFLIISELWLSVAPLDEPQLPFTKELCDMLVTLAEREAPKLHRSRNVDDRQTLFRLALRAGFETPERVMDLAQKLAGLRSFDQAPADPVDPLEQPARPPKSIHRSNRQSGPWPDGPMSPPDKDFQTVALSSPGADFLVRLDKSFAKRVFFALIINPPGRRAHRRGGRDSCEVQEPRPARPPLYDFAPSRLLLAADKDLWLEFALRIVEFATERWAEHQFSVPETTFDDLMYQAPREVCLVIDGEQRRFIGDEIVFDWHRGFGPTAVAAILMTLEAWLYRQVDRDILDEHLVGTLLRRARSAAIVGVLFEVALRHPRLLRGPLEPLVYSAELYRRHNVMRDRELASAEMMKWGMLRGSDGEIKRAEQWHFQAHRQRTFREVVAEEFSARGASWPAIESARELWKVELQGCADQRRQAALESLIHNFDPANWRPVTMPDGKDVMAFVPVAERSEQDKREDLRLAMHAEAIRIPIYCRAIIDGDGRLTNDDPGALLAFARDFVLDDASLERHDPDLPATIRCAVAALTMIIFREWLLAHGEWAAICHEWIISTCTHPPPRPELDVPEDASEMTWDVFCADALPLIWIERGNDSAVRTAVALLAAKRRDSTSRRFATGIARARRDPSRRVDAQRFFHLVVWIARLRHVVDWSRWSRRKIDVESAFVTVGDDFVIGRLEPLPPEWNLIATRWPVSPAPDGTPPGFDDELLAFAFAWIKQDLNDDTLIDDFVIEAALALGTLITDRVRTKEIDAHQPYAADELIADLCAAVACSVSTAEESETLWRPWLMLPESADRWIESFLRALYRRGLSKPDSRFVATLKAIFEIALSPEGILSRNQRFHAADIARALLGVAEAPPRTCWTADREWLAAALRDEWQRWTQVALGWHDCARVFADLMCAPACKSLRVAGLEWIAAVSPEEWLDDPAARTSLLNLLRLVLSEQPALDSTARYAHERLLTALIEAQDPAAILFGQDLGHSVVPKMQ